MITKISRVHHKTLNTVTGSSSRMVLLRRSVPPDTVKLTSKVLNKTKLEEMTHLKNGVLRWKGMQFVYCIIDINPT